MVYQLYTSLLKSNKLQTLRTVLRALVILFRALAVSLLFCSAFFLSLTRLLQNNLKQPIC